MRVLVYPVGKPSEIREIEGGLRSMQEIVGGYIELVRLYFLENGKSVDLFCNEEGKIKGLEPNMVLGNDIVVGDFFVCLGNNETGESESIDDVNIDKVRKMFKDNRI